ncbi:MAG: DUF2085 domain-containing protein [Thermomicrobiales bacterium]
MRVQTDGVAGRQVEPVGVRAIIGANRGIYRVSRHWLAISNALAGVFVLLPILSPLLRANGADQAGSAIDGTFRYLCHQLDDRSFHLAGERVACCHRCLAIYGGLFLIGLSFAAVRDRVGPPRVSVAALLLIPIMVDVLTQPAFDRDSTMPLRVVTGALFALAVNWALLPRLNAGFAGIGTQIETRFDRLVAAGRARPLAGLTGTPR